MRIQASHGNNIVCEHIYPPEVLKVGSRWQDSSGSIVHLIGLKDGWVTYKGLSQPENTKDSFSFQCRYCLIVEPHQPMPEKLPS